jgi:arylsulfatase A-like enzyme/Tfp pilus assembly protein PilF
VLLLLTIDTLRADRLGGGGDPRARTPHLDRLARRGVQYARAISPVPLTLPAHATILSGRLPPDHGARDNGVYLVPENVPLLSETFRSAGWNTAAFVAAYPLAKRFGLSRGFEVYRDAPGFRREGSPAPFVERSAAEVNRELFAWLEERRSSSALFLWVHYFDPHAPFEPDRSYRKAARGDTYRGEVHATDTQIGRLLQRLAREFEEVRVACVADHGESLNEHGEETHGIFVYEATTRVPLILHGDGRLPGTLVGTPVSLSGIAATIAEWAELEPPQAFEAALVKPVPPGRRGIGPGRPAEGDRPLYVESIYPRLRHGWSSLRGFRTARWKVIRAPEPEVYDLEVDPGERTNLIGDPALPRRVGELFTELENPRWADRAPDVASIDPEVEAALASLGYAAVDRRPMSSDESLPDPKTRIRIDRLLSRATGELESGRPRFARAVLSEALTVDPRYKEAHILLGRVEAAEGALRPAFDRFEWCLSLAPASLDPLVHFEIGRLAMDHGLLARAEASLRRCVAGDPLNVEARFNWGVVAYRARRWRDAIERWHLTLDLDPSHPLARKWLPEAERRLAGKGGEAAP